MKKAEKKNYLKRRERQVEWKGVKLMIYSNSFKKGKAKER